LNHNIEIRNLSNFNDISLLKKLYDLNQSNVPEVGSLETLNDFIDLLELSDEILLSYVDNQITGFVVCFFEKSNYESLNYKYFLENYNDFLYIDRIAISLSYRRSGIGSALYQKLIEQYRKTKSIICCEVNIEPINLISLNFHSRFNFQKVGEKDFISHKVRYFVRKDTD